MHGPLSDIPFIVPDWAGEMACIGVPIAVFVLALVRHYYKYIKVRKPGSGFPVAPPNGRADSSDSNLP